LVLFPLSFNKCNKLNEYFYNYFLIIPMIPSDNFFYNCGVIKKKNLYYIFVILLVSLKKLIIVSLLYYNLKTTNIYIFSFHQYQNFIKRHF